MGLEGQGQLSPATAGPVDVNHEDGIAVDLLACFLVFHPAAENDSSTAMAADRRIGITITSHFGSIRTLT